MPVAVRVPICDFVILGGTGDLAVRELLTALYRCDRDGGLPDETRVIATARAGLDDAGYRDKVRGELFRFVDPTCDDVVVERFLNRLSCASLDSSHEAASRWVEPILVRWVESTRAPDYAAGTNGPTAVTSLNERDDRDWCQEQTA